MQDNVPTDAPSKGLDEVLDAAALLTNMTSDAATPRPATKEDSNKDSNEAGDDLFEPLPTHKCKCCGKDLPLSHFYYAGTQIYSRCKRCMADTRRLNKLYLQCQTTSVANWPIELKELISQFDAYQAAGGKIDYAGSLATEAIARYKVAQDCANEIDDKTRELLSALNQSAPAIGELLANITERLAVLESQIAHLGDLTKTQQRSESTGESDVVAKERRRRADLLNKMLADKTLRQRYDEVEISDLVQCFRDAYQCIQDTGFLNSTELWRLVAMLEAKRQPLTIEMEEFYCSYLKDGIAAAKLRDDYPSLVQDVVDHVFANYYDIDWLKIPVDLDAEEKSTE